MLRFSKAKVIVTIGGHPDRPPARRSEPDEPRAAAGDPALPAALASRPGSCRPGRSCSASTSRAARTSSSRSTCQDLMRTPDDAAARRRAPRSARDARRRPRAASSSCRAACRCAFRTRRERDRAHAEAAGTRRSRSATRSSGQTGDRDIQVTDHARRADPAHLYGCRHQRAGPPRRRPGDRGHAPPRRRARHDRAQHPAPGRRPHPRPGAGPAGPAAPEGYPRAGPRSSNSACSPSSQARPTSIFCPRRMTGGQRVPVERRIIVEGGDLTDAQPAFDSRTNEPIVNFRFNIRGAQRFGQATTENVGRPLAIVLDNEVISAPVIQTPITGGAGPDLGPLHGAAGERPRGASARRRAAGQADRRRGAHRRPGPRRRIRSRPARWRPMSPRCSSSLFMFATYGLFGLFANIALIVHVGLIFGLMSVLRGDADVARHRRHRAHHRHGGRFQRADLRAHPRGGACGPHRSSRRIQAGFDRAFATIIDSNSTMAIAAVILFFLGSGPVRGFAVVFILGILTTVITAVTLTRMMIALWYHWMRPKALPF